MSPESVSLLGSFIPLSSVSAKPQERLRLARLILTITVETETAILENRPKDFDALIRNFGCQMTALMVQRSLCKQTIKEEAKKIKAMAVAKIEESRLLLAKAPGQLAERDYASGGTLDIQVSQEMIQLVRFRMLCTVNANKLSDAGREIPYTNTAALKQKEPRLDKVISRLIPELQAEEAKKAIIWIQRESLMLQGQRASLICRQLLACQTTVSRPKTAKAGAPREGTSYTPIDSVPLLYNTEAVFRLYSGVVCIKQKCKLLDQDLDVEPCMLFYDLAKEAIVTEMETKGPILVIEGYVKDKAKLIEMLWMKRFYELLHANSAQCPQYAVGTLKNESSNPFTDEEAICDFAIYKEKKELVDTVFEIDHIFCDFLEGAI